MVFRRARSMGVRTNPWSPVTGEASASSDNRPLPPKRDRRGHVRDALAYWAKGETMKRRLGWAGFLAIVGCGACCAAIPLLSAVGLGGAATLLAGWMGPGTELLAGGAAGA